MFILRRSTGNRGRWRELCVIPRSNKHKPKITSVVSRNIIIINDRYTHEKPPTPERERGGSSLKYNPERKAKIVPLSCNMSYIP